MTLRVVKNALCGVLLTAFLAIPAHAQQEDLTTANPDLLPNVKNLQYGFHQSNIFSISYDLARENMKALYKGEEKSVVNPLIGIAESDLNGDTYPEIISFPTEDEHQTGAFCKKNGLCPHYILQVRGEEVYRLGVIYANSVDAGETAASGYWTLRAYTREYEGKKDYDVYKYDPGKDEFVYANTVTAKED